jgi:hypothetical protein
MTHEMIRFNMINSFSKQKILIIIMINHLFLITILALTTNAIYLPIKANRSRCLIEYLLGGVSTSIKIKINFPKLGGLEPG